LPSGAEQANICATEYVESPTKCVHIAISSYQVSDHGSFVYGTTRLQYLVPEPLGFFSQINVVFAIDYRFEHVNGEYL
jgi:hypothetical protein